MDYSAALIEQNRLFGEVLRGADHSAPVPSCPEWTVQQLFRHVGRGDRWAAEIIAQRAEGPVDPRSVPDGKPPADLDEAMAWFHSGVQLLLDVVATVGPDTPVWTFVGPRPAAWWVRRRLHEATVHRADAVEAVGGTFDLAPDLAADSISEWLDLLVAQSGGRDSALPLQAPNTLHLHASEDTLGSAGEWFIHLQDHRLAYEHAHGKAVTAVRGRSVDLMLATFRRRPTGDSGVEVLGDPAVWDTWLDRTGF